MDVADWRTCDICEMVMIYANIARILKVDEKAGSSSADTDAAGELTPWAWAGSLQQLLVLPTCGQVRW